MESLKLPHKTIGGEQLIVIKEYEIGKSKINVCVERIPTDEEIKKTLTNLYDTVNYIANSLPDKVVSNWFYTEKEIAELKKNPINKFI